VIGLNITFTAEASKFPNLNEVEQKLHSALVHSAEKVEAAAKTNVDERLNRTGLATGALRESISTQFEGQFKASIVSNSVYASIHEFGGVIQAKNAPYLVFKTADGAWHSVKEVTIRATPFLQPALESESPHIQEAIAKIV
jgi:phage gpG-like protein